MRLFNRLKKRWHLTLILLIYFVIAIAHSVVIPLSTGNDEWAHFLYVRFIAEQRRLPATLAERDEAGYKSDAPPLYHLIASGMAFGVEPTRLLRPLDTTRRYLADNDVDPYALVHTAVEQFPYRGEVLIWHLGRGLSIVFGLAVIGLTYQTSLTIAPNNHRRALQASAVVAFIPAFIFHSSVLSYESLSAAISAAFLFTALKATMQPQRWFWWIMLGILAGLSITTKYSAVLLPFEIIFVGWLSFRMEEGQNKNFHLLLRIFIAALATVVAISWWFGFVIGHFNTVAEQGPIVGVLHPILVGDASDTTSVEVAGFLFGKETIDAVSRPPQPRNYLQLMLSLVESFWSAPVAGQFPRGVSPWLPLLFTLVSILGLAGLWRVRIQGDTRIRTILLLLVFHTILILPLLIIRVAFSFDPREVAQGRHILMPAASAIAILLAWGWEKWGGKAGQFFVAGLLLWSVAGQLGWAAMVYPPPLPVWVGEMPETEDLQFEGKDPMLVEGMQFMGYTWRQTAVDPASLEVTLWWKSQAIMGEDYLVELRLLDEMDNVISYSAGHPVQGRYPTRAWEPGDIIQDTHWLPLTMPLNGDYRFQLSLLDHAGQPVSEYQTISLGELISTSLGDDTNPCAVWFQGRPNHGGLLIQPYRLRATFTVIGSELPRLMPLPGHSDQPIQEPFISVSDFHIFMVGPDWPQTYQLVVGSEVCHELSFNLPPRDFASPQIPNPMVINFNNEIQLLGYELPTRRIQPGERLPLALYWQALAYMGEDYQIFDNLLDAEQRRWGGYDRQAQDGYSTLRWEPDEYITDRFGVPVDPAAPDGIYTLDLGWYQKNGNEAISLPIFVANEPSEQSSFRLGPIKVGGPPPDVTINKPTPQKTVNQSFGDQITLLGYDLTTPNSNLETKNLKLTLYWRADTIPTTDYTTFLHLRDNDGQNIAQKDQPPANGRYPTSLWDTGEIIVDEIALPLEGVPPGEYTPVVGLYEFNSGVRLPVDINPHDELHLESIILP